jgi:MFS transporter, FSR family, fosmidomycin resistance protein
MMRILMITQTPRVVWTRTALLFFGHLLNDGYSSFFAPLLPLLIVRLDLSLTLAGALGTVLILINSLAQPGLGHLLDRTQRPFLVILGPLLTIVAMSLIGRVGSFEALVGVLVVAGIGTALFHPAAASLVAANGGKKRGLVMAFFSSGGTLGNAVVPLLIVTYVGAVGIERTPWLIVPGLVALGGLAMTLRRALPRLPARSRATRGPFRIPRPLVLLWVVIVLRSMTATSFSNFLAVIVTRQGGSTFMGGAALSAYLFCGALGGFLAGNLSDRVGRRVVIAGTLALAPPFLLLFLHGPAVLAVPSVAAAGLFLLSSTPVGVVAAQELVPGQVGLVSGLVMGLAWGVGGLILTPVGWLAERFGLATVMSVVALLPLVAAGLSLFYRDTTPAAPGDGLSGLPGEDTELWATPNRPV